MLALCLMMLDSDEDQRNFEEIVKKYERRLYRMAYKILKSRESAEDAVWDAFYHISTNFKKIYNFPVYKMEAYLIITIRTSSYRIYNAEKKHGGNISLDAVYNVSDISELEKYDELAVTNAIGKLDDKYKAVIAYFYYYGHNVDEIAEIMGISKSAVYKYLREARKQLLEKLE